MENRLVDTAGEGGSETNRDRSTDIYALPYVRQIVGACCATGSSAWCSVIAWRGETGTWGEGTRGTGHIYTYG